MPVDVNHGGSVSLDKAVVISESMVSSCQCGPLPTLSNAFDAEAMDQLASAASRILASKKIQEVTLPQLVLQCKTSAKKTTSVFCLCQALKPPPAPRHIAG